MTQATVLVPLLVTSLVTLTIIKYGEHFFFGSRHPWRNFTDLNLYVYCSLALPFYIAGLCLGSVHTEIKSGGLKELYLLPVSKSACIVVKLLPLCILLLGHFLCFLLFLTIEAFLIEAWRPSYNIIGSFSAEYLIVPLILWLCSLPLLLILYAMALYSRNYIIWAGILVLFVICGQAIQVIEYPLLIPNLYPQLYLLEIIRSTRAEASFYSILPAVAPWLIAGLYYIRKLQYRVAAVS